MHRLAVTLIAIASTLTVSTARADALVCGDYLAGRNQPDELTSSTSQSLASDLRACVCEVDCASVCYVHDPIEGDNACGINDPNFAVLGGDTEACDACISESCGALFLACHLDF